VRKDGAFLTTVEAAAMLRLHPKTVRGLAAADQLPAMRHGKR
jgi:excisionase family DNA binding protein